MEFKTIKPKKCRICKVNFTPRTSLQVVCGIDCAKIHAERTRKRLDAKKAKDDRKILREKKERLKTARDYIKEAQISINRYVRLRDYFQPCISCGVMYYENKRGGNFDSGHFRSTGSSPHLRFNLHNIHKQCVKCNRFLSSNSVNYRLNLINRIGLNKVEALECNNSIRRFDIEYLKRIKRIFNKKSRMLEKRILNASRREDKQIDTY